ncbi:retron system putative HNH endonuclease [Aromatoleum toluclasticum]|uniref:retron system putative HNH endonuclease n=1 Tax=Aromatoleum toluclasticum TaxID=92003 RepID=UPI0009FE6C2C|nr:retron system putative HNH endonuclease [Aromatoleum toluclasticum]
MKTIQRSTAPACLGHQPVNQDWGKFIGTPCHVQTDASLRLEQQGLCCYCESTIAPGESHIEHMASRENSPARIYEYSNLAISCNGGKGEHCGRFKDDRHRNPNGVWDAQAFSAPHDPQTCSMFRYLPIGAIEPATAANGKADYLIGYLGLDCPRLNERRRQHASTLTDTLGDASDPEIVAWLRQDYLQPDADGCLKPYYSLSKAILEP